MQKVYLILLASIMGNANVYPAEDIPFAIPSSKTKQIHIAPRIRYVAETNAVWFIQSHPPELGFQPSVSEAETKLILELPRVDFLAFYSCPIDLRDLRAILEKHKPRHVILYSARDETCAELMKHETLEAIVILGGEVTVSGFIFLRRLPNLREIHVTSDKSEMNLSQESLQEWFPEQLATVKVVKTEVVSIRVSERDKAAIPERAAP